MAIRQVIEPDMITNEEAANHLAAQHVEVALEHLQRARQLGTQVNGNHRPLFNKGQRVELVPLGRDPVRPGFVTGIDEEPKIHYFLRVKFDDGEERQINPDVIRGSKAPVIDPLDILLDRAADSLADGGDWKSTRARVEEIISEALQLPKKNSDRERDTNGL